MDSACSIKSMSADLLEDETVENIPLYKESLTCGSKPKLQLLELTENIHAAETNYDSIKMQWDIMKFRHRNDMHNQTERSLSQRSILSFSSLKITVSDHSTQREEVENNDDYSKGQEKNMQEDVETGSQVQVVLTPRSQKTEPRNDDEIVPNLDIPAEDSQESIKTNKRSKKTFKSKKKPCKTNDEQLKTSLIYSAKVKRKKFHGRLRNSNSKSTVVTRDTNYSDKKNDRRKFKRQKSLDVISVLQAPQTRKRVNPLKARESKQLNSKDFVEIYHNAAMKNGSLSVVSSRHSKVGPSHIPNIYEETGEASDDNKSKKNFSVTEEIPGNALDIGTEYGTCEETNENLNKPDDQCHTHAHHIHACTPDYYDPFYQRNYEMPTMASKMKRVPRPFFHRFNIRNIPFVVGTSINPSHNLGLNIQQVLGIIKTKQPIVPGISPLLIRKVSRGMKPVSTLFEHISNQYASSCRNLNYQEIPMNRPPKISTEYHQDTTCYSYINNVPPSIVNQASMKQDITCEPLYEEDEDSRSTSSEPRPKSPIPQGKAYETRMGPYSIPSASLVPKQLIPCGHQKSSKKGERQVEIGVDESLTGNTFHYPNNNKEMTEVFTRLYDQFDKMISQHEKLKEQLEKRKDKSLVKEISELEASITAKEQEITAIVNLYKEVLSLKQQMKVLHERNSFVCIATEDPAFRQISRSAKMQARARTADFAECTMRSRYYNRRTYGEHETPNALRLTGLLRQIQAFQRQLELA